MGEIQAGLRAVIFDFDFTLADSSAGVIECFSGAFLELGLPPPEPEAVRRTIGLSLERALENLTGRTEPGLQERFQVSFFAHADRVMIDRTELLPGVRETLEVLTARGLRLAIVSTKFRFRIESILERHGIRDQFHSVVGREDVELPKPDPEGLRKVLKLLCVSAEEAVYVGDHTVDAEAASRASISFVGVLTGMTTRAGFAEYPRLTVEPSVGELPRFLGFARV